MAASPILSIVGASTRAAAFSALRAGIEPRCADLFGDRDLQTRFSAVRVKGPSYPLAFGPFLEDAPLVPWIYAGGLENHSELIEKFARHRMLWGNDRHAVESVRCPTLVRSLREISGLRFPKVCLLFESPPKTGEWLLKFRYGAGGTGISRWRRTVPCAGTKNRYLQEYIEGQSYAAVFVADGQGARLIGVTEQLVGEVWLNAKPFHYCGSVGPVGLAKALKVALKNFGNQIVERCSLRGIFGVDCVRRDDEIYPIEINPRYTASIEVLELALGIPVLALHRQVFTPAAESVIPRLATSMPQFVGKAIVFARAPVLFPEEGPWLETLRVAPEPFTVPSFADIPFPGETIEKGRPVLTVLTSANSIAATLLALKGQVEKLDKTLYKD
jgi:predicted ATP-grasp superfamily ATP-dependent carboligase